jgi:LuxR family maltose regulon positive regulatory protein
MATLGDILVWTGEFTVARAWLERAARVGHADPEPGTGLLLHLATGMLHVTGESLRSALEEFSTAERIQSRMMGEHSLSGQVTGWTIATKARLGMLDDARAARDAVPTERSRFGEIRNASAVIHLAEGDPTAALEALQVVLDGVAPVIHDFSLVESHLLAARAHMDSGDRRAANDSVERALALAEPDRLIFPFVMTGSRDLLDALPRHATAHTALLLDVLDVMRGSSIAPKDRLGAPPPPELTDMQLRVLRFLPTNLSRREIARELYLSVHTVNTHVRNIYAKLDAGDRSTALKRARELRLLSSPTGR